MSRSLYNVKHTYLGTGLLSEYTFDFKITDLTHLQIVEVDANGDEVYRLRGNDPSFTVTFDAIEGGGSVTLTAPLTASHYLILLLADDAPTQAFEFRNKQSFTLRQFENALDWLSGQIQRLAYRATQAFRIHDLDEESGFNTQLPPGITDIDNANRVFQTNSTSTGLDFGPTTDEIANAQQYATEAAASAEAALESEENAEDSAFEARMLLFNGNLNISATDSPVDIDNTYNSKIVFVDATDGNIIIQFRSIPTYADGFKVQFIRTDDVPANTVQILPFGAETIDSMIEYQLVKGLTVIIAPELDLITEDNWIKKFIGLVNSGSLLPSGGVDGDYLEKQGSDMVLESGVFSGFSATYNRAFDATGLRNVLLDILDFSYLAPQVSLSASGSGTIREKGTAVTSSSLSASVTKRSDPIARIQFFLDGVAIVGADYNPPSNTGTGSQPHAWTGSFQDTSTFRVDVTDDGTTGGPSTVSSSVTFTYVYPYYYGCRAPGATGAQVAALTKDVVVASSSKLVNYTAADGDVFYFAYPLAYSALTSILDVNGFESLSSWTQSTKSITGLDGTTQSYRVYEYNVVQAANSTSFTFKR